MNNKSSFIATAKAKVVALRKKYGIKNQYSMAEIAHKSGLPVEYLKHASPSYPGFLDYHLEPRFIAVNRGLPPHEQALFIARQIAFRAQQQRCNSLALDRPWKWEMLNAAPAQLKQKICQMDVEYRAHWFMLFWATGDEFRAYIRANPKRCWTYSFTDNIVRYHLSMLRVNIWFRNILRAFAIA